MVEYIITQKDILKGICRNKIYKVNLSFVSEGEICLSAISDETAMWHKEFDHVNLRLLTTLHRNGLVKELPKVNDNLHTVCNACATEIKHDLHSSSKAS